MGKKLGAANLPIMSMNAVVQAIIPPPKYKVTDLVTCVVGTRVRMESLYVIERGTPSLTEAISHGTAVDELLENTEDAYGFPPYSSLAPHLVIAGNGPERLRKLERHILSSALSKVSVQRIRVPDYSWPELINAAPATVVVTMPEEHEPVPVISGDWVGVASQAS